MPDRARRGFSAASRIVVDHLGEQLGRTGPILALQVGEAARVTVTVLASDPSPEEAANTGRRPSSTWGKDRK